MKASTEGSNKLNTWEWRGRRGGDAPYATMMERGCSQNEGNHESDEGEKQAQAEMLGGVPDTAAVVGI